jgi:hypothetical protein
MSIMQQSSRAQDRTLGAWFHQIDQGSVKLPRFQRFEAWDRECLSRKLDLRLLGPQDGLPIQHTHTERY